MDLERDQEIQRWLRIINIMGNVGGWIVVGVKMEVRIPSVHFVNGIGIAKGTCCHGFVVGNQVKKVRHKTKAEFTCP